MLKARAGDVLLFGLSARNLELLIQGQPMKIELAELGLKGQVILFYGLNEQELKQSLLDAGAVFAPDHSK